MSTISLDKIWADDLLGRRADAEFILKFLLGRIEERGVRGLPRSYVLNIDASWGKGKTYFLSRLAKSLEAEGYLVASVNAWRDDHAEDPLLAVMAAIDGAVKPILRGKKALRKSWQAVKRIGGAVAVSAIKGAAIHWTRKTIGEGFDLALEQLSSAKDEPSLDAAEIAINTELTSAIDDRAKLLLSGFIEGQRTIESFRTELEIFLSQIPSKERSIPLFVLVDEVDRCRPTYAIALLERIKHLFELNNVIFIIATDTSQLRHAIGAVYGTGFDSQRYLLRFFDRTYVFEEPPLQRFVSFLIASAHLDEEKFSIPPNSDLSLDEMIAGAFMFFGLTPRDAEQCFEILRSISTVWDVEAPIELVVLLPLIIGYQHGIAPALDLECHSALTELVKRNHGQLNSWTFRFERAHENSSRRGDPWERETGLELFARFLNVVSETLPKIMERDLPARRSERWITQQLQQEFIKVHGGRHSPTNAPRSNLTNYPKYIRSAGRLIREPA